MVSLNSQVTKKIDIDQRTLSFSLTVIKLVNQIPRNTAGSVISNQVMRSGTSIGANIEEAIGVHTKTDFQYKMNIAKSEARETKYWLKLLKMSGLVSEKNIESILTECDELIAILSSIVKNSKATK